jgi:hypothetical protein
MFLTYRHSARLSQDTFDDKGIAMNQQQLTTMSVLEMFAEEDQARVRLILSACNFADSDPSPERVFGGRGQRTFNPRQSRRKGALPGMT